MIFVTEDQLYEWGFEDFESLGEGTFNENGEYGWYIEGDDTDADNNGIPDVVDALMGNPVSQHISQGGAWGG